jgi:hypothetical protein
MDNPNSANGEAGVRPHGLLPAGTPVRYDGAGEPEFGIVVHCWIDEETGLPDCYVAFFGSERPQGRPAEKPYILRYALTSLAVLGLEATQSPERFRERVGKLVKHRPVEKPE